MTAKWYNLVTVLECEFKQFIKYNPGYDIKMDKYVAPLNPKEGFYIGRCEPIKLYYDFKKRYEKGKYVDFVSLYPTVNNYDYYPVDIEFKLQIKDYYQNIIQHGIV